MLNRKEQPNIDTIKNINIVEPEIIKAPNGIEIHLLNLSEQDVVRIDIMINAGKWDQDKNLEAMFSNLLLKEGAGGLSALEIAEQLDYYEIGRASCRERVYVLV